MRSNRHRRVFRWLLPMVIVSLGPGEPAYPQAQDNASYLRGLIERGESEALEQYLQRVEQSDPITAAHQRILVERIRMGDEDAGSRSRREGIERILELRRVLIERNPTDPRRVTWMVDQASDLFHELFAFEASGLTALWGYPSPQQLEIARRVAREMSEVAAGAETVVQRIILELEDKPGFNRDANLQLQRRRLAENERDRRIPYYQGIAAFLHAELNVTNQQEKRRLQELASRLLLPLADILEGDLAARARLYAGLALGRLGALGESESQVNQVIADSESLAADVFAARMGLIDIQVQRRGTEAGLEGLSRVKELYHAQDDFFFQVLIADREFLMFRRLAAMDNSFALADAFRAYLSLLEWRGGLSRQKLLLVVFSRLVNASDEHTPREELPGLVTVARASRLLRDGGSLDVAITLYQNVLSGNGLDQHEYPLALFELARTHHANNQPLEAVRRFTELARNHPTHNNAERAIELAVSIAETMRRDEPRSTEVRQSMRRALEVLLHGYPNLASIDLWRYTAGRLALMEKRFDDALGRFTEISPDADLWVDGQFMQAVVERTRAISGADKNNSGSHNDSVIRVFWSVRTKLQRVLKGLTDRKRSDVIGYYLGMLNVFEAEVEVGRHRFEQALAVLEGIENEPHLGKKVLAEVLKVRILAYRGAGRAVDAQQEIARFITAAPDQVVTVLGPMLLSMQSEVELLLDQNQDRKATDLASQTLVPIANELLRWQERTGSTVAGGGGLGTDGSTLTIHIADSFRLGGRHSDALPLYEQLLRDNSQAIQYLFGKAECLYALGGERRLGQAMLIFRRLAAIGRGSSSASEAYYWQSQLRMLQILDRMGRNTAKIVPRIRQLRQIDQNLGGERYRRQFQQLQNRHS